MPADEVVKGLNAFTEQPIERNKEKGRPWTTRRRFLGPQALTEAKEEELLLLNPLTLSTKKGIPAEIIIETDDAGGNSQVIDQIALNEVVWELDWDRLEKDIRSHGYFYESAISYGWFEKIDAAVRKGTAAGTNWNTASGLTRLETYRECRLLGIDSYVAYSPIIRCTLVTRSSSSIRTPPVAATKIVHWSDIALPITGAVKTPNDARIDRPTIHYYVAGVGWSDPDTVVDEWMIAPAKNRFNSTRRKENIITFEWYGAEKWTKALYDGGTGYPPT